MNCRSGSWFLSDLELNIRSKNIGCHVATSQRRNTWSTKESQQNDPTSRRHKVVTSQHRHVATSQHRHDFCTSIIKSKGRPNFEIIEKRTDERMENRAAMTWIIGEDTFVFFSLLINYE